MGYQQVLPSASTQDGLQPKPDSAPTYALWICQHWKPSVGGGELSGTALLEHTYMRCFALPCTRVGHGCPSLGCAKPCKGQCHLERFRCHL